MSSLWFQVISCGRFCVASHLSWSLVVTCMVPGPWLLVVLWSFHLWSLVVICLYLWLHVIAGRSWSYMFVYSIHVICGNLWSSMVISITDHPCLFMFIWSIYIISVLLWLFVVLWSFHLWLLMFICGRMWSLVVRGHTYSCSQSMSFVETCDHLCSFLSIIIRTCFGSMFIWSIYIISVHLWFLVVICGHVWYFVVSGRSWSFTLLSTTFVFNFVCLCSFLITCTSMVIPLVVTCGRMCLSTVICDRLSFAVFHARMFICVYFWLITCSHLWSFDHSTCGLWSFAVIHVYVHSITIVVTYGNLWLSAFIWEQESLVTFYAHTIVHTVCGRLRSYGSFTSFAVIYDISDISYYL